MDDKKKRGQEGVSEEKDAIINRKDRRTKRRVQTENGDDREAREDSEKMGCRKDRDMLDHALRKKDE
jgi:hypothetical protein